MTEMADNIQRVNFTVKSPNEKEKRATFAILKVTYFKDGTKKKAEKINDDRIGVINEEWESRQKQNPRKMNYWFKSKKSRPTKEI